jgi:ketosteroid isomerase-like protein
MELDENKKLVKQFFDAIAGGDTARMDELMTDDATWWVAPSTVFSGLHQKQDFLAIVPQLFAQAAGPLTFEFYDLTAEGDRVSVTAKGNLLMKSGKTYQSDYHFLLRVRDGKIAGGREYLNSAHVNDIFGHPEAA